MKPLADCRLYAFVDAAYLRGRDPVELAHALCDGGADLIQYRAKNESADVTRRVAERLLPVTRAAGVPLVINDHWELACELGAPVCHLGQEDFFDAGLKRKSELGATSASSSTSRTSVSGPPLLGLSSHAPEQAKR
ncbi:MAG TPA: thiamine phosphate synthase, partial [Verrucomicrobiales bacterium]|nr:thiamine phosphate synthase [Verrucomicrobiales bacterium]